MRPATEFTTLPSDETLILLSFAIEGIPRIVSQYGLPPSELIKELRLPDSKIRREIIRNFLNQYGNRIIPLNNILSYYVHSITNPSLKFNPQFISPSTLAQFFNIDFYSQFWVYIPPSNAPMFLISPEGFTTTNRINIIKTISPPSKLYDVMIETTISFRIKFGKNYKISDFISEMPLKYALSDLIQSMNFKQLNINYTIYTKNLLFKFSNNNQLDKIHINKHYSTSNFQSAHALINKLSSELTNNISSILSNGILPKQIEGEITLLIPLNTEVVEFTAISPLIAYDPDTMKYLVLNEYDPLPEEDEYTQILEEIPYSDTEIEAQLSDELELEVPYHSPSIDNLIAELKEFMKRGHSNMTNPL